MPSLLNLLLGIFISDARLIHCVISYWVTLYCDLSVEDCTADTSGHNLINMESALRTEINILIIRSNSNDKFINIYNTELAELIKKQ